MLESYRETSIYRPSLIEGDWTNHTTAIPIPLESLIISIVLFLLKVELVDIRNNSSHRTSNTSYFILKYKPEEYLDVYLWHFLQATDTASLAVNNV